MITLQLFLSFLQIGLFSFGGGYAAMPLLQEQLVARNGWLSVQEFADLVTIAEMTPGPIAVNAATFVGTKLAGLPGALAATAGVIFARVYFGDLHCQTLSEISQFVHPAGHSRHTASGCGCDDRIGRCAASGKCFLGWGAGDACRDKLDDAAAFAGCLLLLRKTKLSPILIMVLAGVINVVKAVLAG